MENEVDVQELLNELGWSDGFHIPVANEENKALELEVQKKQKERENLKSVLEDVTDRLLALRKHQASVDKEKAENQNLLYAHQSQIQAEENMLKLAQAEESHLSHDIRELKKECADLKQRQDVAQAEINRLLDKIEKLKATVRWDKEALQAWDEEVTRGDEDTNTLQKFTKEDETKYRELELRRQNVRMEVEDKRHKLVQVKNDLISMEGELEKTALMYRRQHKDRQALIRQWESCVRILHQRDEDINRTIEEIGALRTLGKEKMKDLKEQKTFYENEVSNNKELEKEIDIWNKEAGETKEKVGLLEANLQEMSSNLLAMKGMLTNTTNLVRNQRSKTKRVSEDMVTKMEQIDGTILKVQQLGQELLKMKSQTMSASDRVEKLEAMLKKEEKAMDSVMDDSRKLGELMYQVSEQLNAMKSRDTSQRNEMSGIEATDVILRKDIERLKKELVKQKEILYQMDFAYMEKDIQLNKMLGVVLEEDKDKFEAKATELEETHKKILATHALLVKEVSRMEDDMRKITTDLFNDSKELDALKSKRQDNILMTEGGLKQVKVLRTKNQDTQVEENVLRLRVKQAEKIIDKVGGKVFSLEKQRLELEEAMREREIEITALRDVLSVRKRVLAEQAANLRGKINLGQIKVDQLMKKYEVSIGKLGTDEDGQQLSVTYFKIKTAQEKYELQQIGDKLDAKVRKTEKEILAMENTLKVVNATNKAYKINLQQIDEDSPEQCEKIELDMMYGEALEQLRDKKATLELLNETTARMEQAYKEQLQLEDQILTAWKEKDQKATELDKDLREQEEKLCRAEKQLKRLVREIRGTQVTKFQTIEEKDIELREIIEQNQSGLQQLAELVAKTMDTGPVVNRYLSEKGLSLPTIKSPGSSIKYGSSSSLLSPGRASTTSRSSEVPSSRASSCAISPSVVSLDGSRFSGLTGETRSKSLSSRPSKLTLGRPSTFPQRQLSQDKTKSTPDVVDIVFDKKSSK